MPHTPLTSDALAKICQVASIPSSSKADPTQRSSEHPQGEEAHEPVLQILGHKVITGNGLDR